MSTIVYVLGGLVVIGTAIIICSNIRMPKYLDATAATDRQRRRRAPPTPAPAYTTTPRAADPPLDLPPYTKESGTATSRGDYGGAINDDPPSRPVVNHVCADDAIAAAV
ncbi:hypothetical protein BDZ88DRAFT_450495 [Geranomyces variabilis]|nr:hypothetical protein BDZ88DRAFT_450495 [Geranomyces variabilis]